MAHSAKLIIARKCIYLFPKRVTSIFKCVYGVLVPWGSTPVVDVNVQYANVTGSMKLCNTKLCVVGHYFCCTIRSVAYCGRAKCERNVLHRFSIINQQQSAVDCTRWLTMLAIRGIIITVYQIFFSLYIRQSVYVSNF